MDENINDIPARRLRKAMAIVLILMLLLIIPMITQVKTEAKEEGYGKMYLLNTDGPSMWLYEYNGEQYIIVSTGDGVAITKK